MGTADRRFDSRISVDRGRAPERRVARVPSEARLLELACVCGHRSTQCRRWVWTAQGPCMGPAALYLGLSNLRLDRRGLSSGTWRERDAGSALGHVVDWIWNRTVLPHEASRPSIL